MRTTSMPGASEGVMNRVAPMSWPRSSRVRAMMIWNADPGSPVMNHLRPLIR